RGLALQLYLDHFERLAAHVLGKVRRRRQRHGLTCRATDLFRAPIRIREARRRIRHEDDDRFRMRVHLGLLAGAIANSDDSNPVVLEFDGVVLRVDSDRILLGGGRAHGILLLEPVIVAFGPQPRASLPREERAIAKRSARFSSCAECVSTITSGVGRGARASRAHGSSTCERSALGMLCRWTCPTFCLRRGSESRSCSAGSTPGASRRLPL